MITAITDKNGTAIKAGDNVAFAGPNKATDWDVLSGTVDLSGYYTKSDIDSTVATLNASIKTADDKAVAAQNTATQALNKATNLENAGYQTADDVQQILDRKSTRLNSSHDRQSRMPSSA